MKPTAERSYRAMLWTLAFFGLALDQGTKYGVFKWLYNDGYGDKRQVVAGVFELLADYGERQDTGANTLQTWSGPVLPKVNHGALFGFGREHVTAANVTFAVISIAAAIAIIYWSTRPTTARDPSLCGALGLILAGTLGNFYDRVVFNGVRDFLHFYWFEWPVFNVADCCLVCGAGLLLVQAFLNPQPVADVPKENAMSVEVAHVP